MRDAGSEQGRCDVGIVIALSELLPIRNRARDEGKTVVFTNGCFDLLHLGHVHYLGRARQFGDILVVGLNDDASVTRVKGEGRPIIPEDERASIVAALECVDYVTIFGETTPARLIAALVPDVLVKGGDYRVEDIVGRETVEGAGGRVEVVEPVPGRSTSGLIRAICGQFGP